jgi:hypothetical protein
LIDCLREGPTDRITINDLYEYAHSRLTVSANQTPLFWALQQEGPAIEIGNYQAKHEREWREAHNQLIATARTKFDTLQANGVLTQGQIESILRHLEECDEATRLPHEWAFRDNVIRYLKGEVDFVSVFAREFISAVPAKHEIEPPVAPPTVDPQNTPHGPQQAELVLWSCGAEGRVPRFAHRRVTLFFCPIRASS